MPDDTSQPASHSAADVAADVFGGVVGRVFGRVVGRVVALAVRPKTWTPMELRDSLDITSAHGIAGDHGTSKKRGVTLLSQQHWHATIDDLGISEDDLPWTTRRANVLIDAPTLQPLIGHTIQLGTVTIEILAETDPCHVMDQQHAGLKRALEPNCRGGVYGRITHGGAVRIGDVVRVVSRES